MKFAGRVMQARWLFVVGILLIPSLSCLIASVNIESGGYVSGALSTNAGERTNSFVFFAISNDTVIVRGASDSALYPNASPNLSVYHVYSVPVQPSNTLIASISEGIAVNELQFPVTNYGWHRIDCALPASLNSSSNPFSYSMSILRMPGYPLSYQDLDVGPIVNGGGNDQGTINVGADLDAVTFVVSNQCRVQLRMGQKVYTEVPNVKLYSPSGAQITNDFPPEYRAEISAVLTQAGIYTVVCNDQLNATGPYNVSMILIPGQINLSSDDPDFGPMINGETRTGTINQPGDLDIATFTAMLGDTNVLTMTKISADMNPRMELFDPTGLNVLAAPADMFHTTVSVTNVCTNAGAFYVICKDAEDRFGKQYTLTMQTLGGPSALLIPDTPSGISASDGTYTNTIVIAWGSATNATGYDLWRSDGTNTAVYVWLVTNTTYIYYQDSNATPNAAYYYKVKSRNAYGTSAFSTNDLGYCGAVPAIPTGLIASDGTLLNYILVTWSSVTNATGYDLWRTTIANSTVYVELITNYASASYQDFNVINNRTYNYKVKSRNIVGASDFSASDSGYCIGTNTGASFDLHNDYDGDGVSDLAIYSEASGNWHIGSVRRQVVIGTNIVLGGPGYHPITGDYDGDRKADLTVYSESGGTWRIGSLARWAIIAWDAVWGGPGWRPVVGDYNGDGYDDGALYEAANGYWYVVTTFGRVLVNGDSFTGAGFTAVPGDYNGDGIADYALYHNEQGYWYVLASGGSNLTWGTSWGAQGYVPVSGDYDSDGRSDLAVYSEATGLWSIWSLAQGRTIASGISFGEPGYTPVPGDYNGDRKADLAVYQQSTGNWSIRTVDSAQQAVYNFGGPDYIPVRPAW